MDEKVLKPFLSSIQWSVSLVITNQCHLQNKVLVRREGAHGLGCIPTDVGLRERS